ncbi:hypothetical protein TNCV_5087811 [Trichonephila clavipes]|nr:hypothetical protein TNCV_5087811 [Trichonephila clavipes]
MTWLDESKLAGMSIFVSEFLSVANKLGHRRLIGASLAPGLKQSSIPYLERVYDKLGMQKPSTPSTLEPTTAYSQRRAAMTRLKNQETMIEGYQEVLGFLQQRKRRARNFIIQLQESLNETIEARDSLTACASFSPSRHWSSSLVATPPLHSKLRTPIKHVSPDQGRRNLTRFQFPYKS